MSFDEKTFDSSPGCILHTEVDGLDAKEALCLSAYVDGECGWLKRFFAQRVLARSFQARKFVDELERTSDQIQHNYRCELDSLSEDISLWPRISARIAQEERLTLLRSIPVDTGGFVSWGTRLSWSGLGAIAAALLMVVYLPISSDKMLPQSLAKNSLALVSSNSGLQAETQPVVYDSNGTKRLSPVSLEGNQQTLGRVSDEDYRALQLASIQADRSGGYFESRSRDPNAWRFIQQQPQYLPSEGTLSFDSSDGLLLSNQRRVMAPQVFEADWVRSNGRVRVLQDPSGKAAIIWINRSHNAVAPSKETRQSMNAFVEKVGNR